MRRVVFAVTVVVCCGAGWGQSTDWPVGPGHSVLTLWPQGAPGPNTTKGPEADTSTATSDKIAGRPLVRLGNVSAPILTLFAKETPPTFLVQAEDDTVHVENAVAYFLALKNAGVPAEPHLYAKGGHGYGLRRTQLPVTEWPDRVDEWLRTIGVVSGSR